MAIDIKEIFVSDLDPNSSDWWSNDKINKINYNFSQLSRGGMIGPQGSTGIDGPFGSVGAQGPQGHTGPVGIQGPQGATAIEDWVNYTDQANSVNYLFPKKNEATETEYSSVVLRLGISSIDPLYDDATDTYNQYAMLSNINPDNDPKSPKINLRVQHLGKFADWQLLNDGDDIKLKVGSFVTADPGFQIVHLSKNTKLNTIGFEDSIQVAHEIKDSLIKINSREAIGGLPEAIAETNLKFNSTDTFKYNRNANINDILVADDDLGTSNWKNKRLVFDVFPVGTVISIRESDFNANNFYLDEETLQQTSPPRNRYGRGKQGTDFAGWYLCNGETWQLSPSSYGITTPNLNSFNYSISANTGNPSDDADGGDNTSIILGGYDIEMSASYDGTGTYFTQFTNGWDIGDEEIQFNGVQFGLEDVLVDLYASRMVHIVYLENENLTWTNPPSGQTPQINPISLGFLKDNIFQKTVNEALKDICGVTKTSTYYWGGTQGDWSDFNYPLSEVYLYSSAINPIFASTGWYIDTNTKIWRYWNGATGTLSEATQCPSVPPSNPINLVRELRVEDLNGEVSTLGTGVTYNINTSSFSAATMLILNGNPAQGGWYRDINSGVRRYWNGATLLFDGVTFTQDYVLLVKDENNKTTGFNMVTSNAFSCPGNGLKVSITPHLSYIQSETQIETSIIDIVGKVLYVHKNWTPPTGFTPALVNIKDQNASGFPYPWRRVYHHNVTPGTATPNSPINAIFGTVSGPFTICD